MSLGLLQKWTDRSIWLRQRDAYYSHRCHAPLYLSCSTLSVQSVQSVHLSILLQFFLPSFGLPHNLRTWIFYSLFSRGCFLLPERATGASLSGSSTIGASFIFTMSTLSPTPEARVYISRAYAHSALQRYASTLINRFRFCVFKKDLLQICCRIAHSPLFWKNSSSRL